MRQLFFSAKLYIYGGFCDACASFCTHLAEKCITQNKPLNKKLLTFMSNFSDNNFVKWQRFERWFIDEFVTSPHPRLPLL